MEKKYLSGYDDELKVDFYPVKLQCTTYTDIKTERMEGVRIRIEVKKKSVAGCRGKISD